MTVSSIGGMDVFHLRRFTELTADDRDFFLFGGGSRRGTIRRDYDGQPVLIWNDRRGSQLLLKDLGGVGNVYRKKEKRKETFLGTTNE